MHFRHIFPGQDKAVPSFGEAVEEWKPPDIYSRYKRHAMNTILHYMLGFFSSFFKYIFSHIFFHYYTTQECNLHPHTTKRTVWYCGYIKPLKSMH